MSRDLAAGSSCCSLSFSNCAGPLQLTTTGSLRVYPRVQLSGGRASACRYTASNCNTGSHQVSGVDGGPNRNIADVKSMQCVSRSSHAAADCSASKSCPYSSQDLEWQKRVKTAKDAADTALQRLKEQERRDTEMECARKKGDYGLYPLSQHARQKASEPSVRPHSTYL